LKIISHSFNLQVDSEIKHKTKMKIVIVVLALVAGKFATNVAY